MEPSGRRTRDAQPAAPAHHDAFDDRLAAVKKSLSQTLAPLTAGDSPDNAWRWAAPAASRRCRSCTCTCRTKTCCRRTAVPPGPRGSPRLTTLLLRLAGRRLFRRTAASRASLRPATNCLQSAGQLRLHLGLHHHRIVFVLQSMMWPCSSARTAPPRCTGYGIRAVVTMGNALVMSCAARPSRRPSAPTPRHRTASLAARFVPPGDSPPNRAYLTR